MYKPNLFILHDPFSVITQFFTVTLANSTTTTCHYINLTDVSVASNFFILLLLLHPCNKNDRP